MIFLTILLVTQDYIVSNGRMINEMGRMWKGAVMD
jgi:hypothetical protein